MKTSTAESSITNHPVVSHEQWVAERKRLLAREKELTHLRDQIARERRALPWARIDKIYKFEAPEGARTLGPPPADGAALHARAGVGGGLPELLLHG
jgi:predicted dithiol-disulfide oxidoreductase (DUF899 family)